MTLATALFVGLLAQAAGTAAPQAPSAAVDGLRQPRKLKHVAPRYPDDARRAGLAQEVVLECRVDAKGRVGNVALVKGVPPLSDAAIEAVKRWRYEPTLVDGKPVPVVITVTVSFRIDSIHHADLMKSLESRNAYVREAAAENLGAAEVTSLLHQPNQARSLASTIQELERLASEDHSPLVRAAAERSLTRFGRASRAGGASAERDSGASGAPPPWMGEFDAPPKVLRQARPQYPQNAFAKRIEGTVLIEALIDLEGRVARCRVLQSVPELDAAALAAVKQWRFEPARKGGQPVATIVHMPVAFRIYDKKK